MGALVKLWLAVFQAGQGCDLALQLGVAATFHIPAGRVQLAKQLSILQGGDAGLCTACQPPPGGASEERDIGAATESSTACEVLGRLPSLQAGKASKGWVACSRFSWEWLRLFTYLQAQILPQLIKQLTTL